MADSGARVLVVEQRTLDAARQIRQRGQTALETIVLADGAAGDAVGWSELVALGDPGFDLEASSAHVTPDDLLTLIYTSGTTGAPKGVQLTHRNVTSQLHAMQRRLSLTEMLTAVSWLPMAHIAERLCTHYLPLALGWEVTTCGDPRAIGSVLRDVRPRFFFSPPRLWEKLRTGILTSAGDVTGDAAAAAEARASVGLDQVRVAIVGAAPCPREVVDFWRGIGVPLLEVYGLSETTGVATINPPEAVRSGTVGTPLDGVELRLSDEGEILIRGSVVMAGYRNLPERTAEAIDADGWFHTGDVGVLEDVYLRIVDRIKELIINAAGKNMSPTNIEATITTSSPLIAQACCIGDGRPYNTALVVLDADAAATGGADAGSASASDDRLLTAVNDAIEQANDRLARVEQIKRFVIVPGEWQPGGDEVTPTMKLKRKAIATKYAAEIEQMYQQSKP